jgi:hypothetical protein
MDLSKSNSLAYPLPTSGFWRAINFCIWRHSAFPTSVVAAVAVLMRQELRDHMFKLAKGWLSNPHHSARDQGEQCHGGSRVKHAMERVWHNSVADGQDGVGASEHLFVSRGALRFRADQIGQPPCPQLAGEERQIAHPKPGPRPGRMLGFPIEDGEHQPQGERRRLNQRDANQTGPRILCLDTRDVVQRSKRRPIVEPQYDDLQGLKRDQ